MRRLLLILLLMPVFATTDLYITTSSSTIYTYEPVTFNVQVYDNDVLVNYPQCNITIKKDKEVVLFSKMTSEENDATATIEFTDTDDRTVLIKCEDTTESLSLQVNPNAELSISMTKSATVGSYVNIYAGYFDRFGATISQGTCDVDISVNGEYYSQGELYLSGNYFTNSFQIWRDGNFEFTIRCFASGYITRTATEKLTVEKIPITISADSGTYSEAKYGNTVNFPFTVNPSDSTCTTSKGSVSGSTSYRILSVNVDFVGEKKIQVTCQKQYYATATKTFIIKGKEVPTQVNIETTTKTPYSFQKVKITPNYYTATWENIQNAECTIETPNKTMHIKSFETVNIKMPAGPATEKITITCSKFGYQTQTNQIKLEIKPIHLGGTVTYPQASKEKEPIVLEVSLNPGIRANCTFDSRITSEISSLTFPAQKKEINGDGNFTLIPEDIGKLNFEIVCTAKGYSTFSKKGEIDIKIFSGNEEIGATIVLTTLTAILAVSFLLIKRWL